MLGKSEDRSENKAVINIRINRIDEISYQCNINEKITTDFDPAHLQIMLSNNMDTDITNDKFEVVVSVIYQYLNQKLVEYTVKVNYYIENLASYIEPVENSIKVTPDFVPILINTAIGAMRGMLVLKTSSNFLSEYPLPLIDIHNFMNANEV